MQSQNHQHHGIMPGPMLSPPHRHMMGVNNQHQMGMPVISGTMSLRHLRPKAPTPSVSPRLPQSSMQRPPRQMAAFIPQTSPIPTSRPVQVRTVFVPPPMKMKSSSGLTPSTSNGSSGPKMINSFPLNIPVSLPMAAGISITPLAIGKSNGLAPVIKGVDAVNGNLSSKKVDDDSYDDVELDEDDDGIDENDEEYNEIRETSDSTNHILNGPQGHAKKDKSELVIPKQATPLIANVTSLRRESNDSQASSIDSVKMNQRAKKSFKHNSDKISLNLTGRQTMNFDKTKNGDSESQSKKRPMEASNFSMNEGSKKPRIEILDTSNNLDEPTSQALKTKPVEKRKIVPAAVPTGGHYKDGVRQLCMCNADPILDSNLGPSYICQAVEVVGGHRVGCKNKVARIELMRINSNEKAILCDLHRDRLKSHGCCPICGEFCSHGLVYMCRTSKNEGPHMFHRACYQMKNKDDRMCPHCGSRRAPLAVQLKITMTRAPLKFLQYTSKMSVSKPPEKPERWEADKLREKMIHYKLPNGRIISADNLPRGLEPSKLEDILKNFDSKTHAKCTTRNMFVPTSAGDNVKLLQLLALDYSPRQKFPEADGGTPLHVAASNNHTLTGHILVQAGAEIDAFDDNNETPLMIAAYNGFPSIVRYLIAAGAKLELKSDDGMTALHLATQNGHLECAHIILGSNNLPRNHINVKDDGGWTPLVWACEHKHEGVIRFLLEQGCDPFATDVEMNVALHWAAFSGSKSVVEVLLAAGCNVNQANAIGETPLHISLRQDNYECALFLVARGARLDIANNQGQLPAHCISSETSKAAALVQLGTTLQKLMNERKAKFLTEKTVAQDISNAKETIPVTAVNGEDFEMGPSGYVYVKNNVVTSPLPIDRNIANLQHCKCKDNCQNEDTCKCSDISVRSWYDQNSVLKEGFDFQEPPMIFECNDMCSCNVNSCNNRVVQHGITARMQVYKTYGMGWGVKSLVDIPKGGFVCEYVGELISDAEAEQRENDSYLFDLENRDGDTFCIDANRFGNVTRFINHSCSPNLVPVKVFTSHQDLRFPHIAMFASKIIKKGDVLGFDYGEKFWVIKHKYFTCWCGLEKCKYSKTAIGKTLQEYYKKNELNKSPIEEEQKQTGKLKLKLKMEEGKVVKVDDSGLLPDEPDVKKEDRKSPLERAISAEKKIEEKHEKKSIDNIKENGKKSEKTGISTPERFEKPKRGPKSSGAKKSQDVPRKLKSDENYNKTPGRNTEIKKTVLSKELDNEKDEFDFSDGDSPTRRLNAEKISQFPRKSKEKNTNEGESESLEVKTEDEIPKLKFSNLETHDEDKKEEGHLDAVENGNNLIESIKRIMQDDDDIPNIKKQKLSEEEHKKLENSMIDDSVQNAETVSKFYCNICNMEFDRDDKMLFHQDECKKNIEPETLVKADVNQSSKSKAPKNQCNQCNKIFKKEDKLTKHKKMCRAPLTPRKREEKYRCKTCTQQFRKEEKLFIHMAKCNGETETPLPEKSILLEDKIEENGSHHNSEDSLNDNKNLNLEKNVAITIVNEENVDHLRDTKIIEGKEEVNEDVPVTVETPVVEAPAEVAVTPKKGRGRPKKIIELSKILEQVPPSPPVPQRRTSSTSRRTSASSRSSLTTSTLNLETTTAVPTTHLIVARKSLPEPEVPDAVVPHSEPILTTLTTETTITTDILTTAQPYKTQPETSVQTPTSNTRPKRSRKVIDKDL